MLLSERSARAACSVLILCEYSYKGLNLSRIASMLCTDVVLDASVELTPWCVVGVRDLLRLGVWLCSIDLGGACGRALDVHVARMLASVTESCNDRLGGVRGRILAILEGGGCKSASTTAAKRCMRPASSWAASICSCLTLRGAGISQRELESYVKAANA